MQTTARVWGSPLRYVQGPDVLLQVGLEARRWGQHAVLVADDTVMSLVACTLAQSCREAGVSILPLRFEGNITHAEVHRLEQAVAGQACELVIAAGGGKSLDAGKGLAHRLGVPVLTVPTAASTDAPTSAVYVLYDDHHNLVEVCHLPHNPVAVLVDTRLIARAPAHLLIAGIGDALSKRFEVAACLAAQGRNSFGGRSPWAAMALAQACDELLLQHARAALAAVQRGEPDDHLEQLVEATVLLSGLCFESGGLSLAHALTRGLSQLPGVGQALHGLQVAWGVRVQWELEGQPSDFWAQRDAFYRDIGLPLSLKDLGLQVTPLPKQWLEVAKRTLSAPPARNLTRRLSPEDLVQALIRVEARGQTPATSHLNR